MTKTQKMLHNKIADLASALAEDWQARCSGTPTMSRQERVRKTRELNTLHAQLAASYRR